MEPGANVDIVTLRPKVLKNENAAALRAAREEKELRAQAEDLALGFSEDGERFRALVTGRLEKRIEELVKADPEASAYLKLLEEMGHKFNTAKRAVEKLYQRHMGTQT